MRANATPEEHHQTRSIPAEVCCLYSMLIDLLERDAVSLDALQGKYGALLELVRRLLGIVPNCDSYLEIWPPAFRTYNVMVPNLLNLPFMVWRLGAPGAAIGLAMYVSSRTAGCAYCSAHSCTFALRRGASVDAVASALEENSGLSSAERAAVRVARAMSRVPAAVNEEVRAELFRCFSANDAEWIVLAVAMMGWLNKAMDALGVPLEEPTVAEVMSVIAPSGWRPGQHLKNPVTAKDPPQADSLFARLSLIRHAPRAVAYDRQWTRGVPDKWPLVGEYLRRETGHTFPVLSRIQSRRAVRAIAAMIRENLSETIVGRSEKLAAGLVYARTVGDDGLCAELHSLGGREAGDSPLKSLARAISPSPAEVNLALLESSRAIPPAGVVELVSFIALLQMLHRLGSFFPPALSN